LESEIRSAKGILRSAKINQTSMSANVIQYVKRT
jgi:hypothetical protein